MRLNGRSVRLFTDKHLENIGSMFKTLYKDELLTDCTLYCKNGSVKAHKLILAASSPYFRKVFLEHNDEHAIFIMHGVSVDQLQDLLELIYKGSIDIPSETLNYVFDLAEELQISGVLLEEGSSDTKSNRHGRDTRYKGQKRVAVDFISEDNEPLPSKVVRTAVERRPSTGSEKGLGKKTSGESSNIQECDCPFEPESSRPESASENNLNGSQNNDNSSAASEKSKVVPHRNEILNIDETMDHSFDEQNNLSVWARKERKFKCDLCPSSFKRASHLTRHQLVHTGERPFACTQCDKAFSRHDKLKHHIHKAHELGPLNDSLPPDSLYTIGHVRILTPEQTMFESPEPISQPSQSSQTEAEVPASTAPPQKKGRGRPRKYPVVPPPLIKRPRGRPRLNPIVPQEPVRREDYDISNMPYGDIEYLTKPLHENNEEMSIHEHGLMEPLVEIKTEPQEKSDHEREDNNGSFLENIGLFENSAIAKIGECTISVANNSNNSS